MISLTTRLYLLYFYATLLPLLTYFIIFSVDNIRYHLFKGARK